MKCFRILYLFYNGEDGEECQRHRRRRRDDDSTKEPCDDDETTAEATDAPAADIELRRNLGRGRRGRRRGDVTKEPLADGETREPRQTREPRDATKEPCEVPRNSKNLPRSIYKFAAFVKFPRNEFPIHVLITRRDFIFQKGIICF